MANVAIVVDSTHYLPAELARAARLHEVSLYVNADGEARPELTITDYDAFYASLRGDGALPTTSQPSIGDFLAVYEPLAQAGSDIVSIHISTGISGTAESARQAASQLAEQHPERTFEVVDSTTGAGALGCTALAAAAVRDAGGDAAAVAARAREAGAAARLYFVVDTLEYLRRGGRIGAAQAWIGGALKVKPILTFDGEVTPLERVRTRGRALARLDDLTRERLADGADAWFVQHIQAPDDAAALVQRARGVFGHDPLFSSELGPVVGIHCGPGLIGFGGLPSALLRA